VYCIQILTLLLFINLLSFIYKLVLLIMVYKYKTIEFGLSKINREGNIMKYKVFLIILVSIILLLSGCDKQSSSTIIEFEEFDLSDLTICLDAMMDEDDETVCSQEDGKEYLLAYANNFIQYLDQQATANVHLSYNSNLIMTIGFDDLPVSLSQDSIDVFNQLVEKIHFDISDIIINELGYVIDFRPEVTFSGVKISGFSEYYDVDSFQYINRYMTREIYVAQMTYYEDTVLTDNIDVILD